AFLSRLGKAALISSKWEYGSEGRTSRSVFPEGRFLILSESEFRSARVNSTVGLAYAGVSPAPCTTRTSCARARTPSTCFDRHLISLPTYRTWARTQRILSPDLTCQRGGPG